MDKVVQVRRRHKGKIQFYLPGELQLKIGDFCVIEQERGLDYGKVLSGPLDWEERSNQVKLRRIIRKMTPEDLEQMEANWRDSSVAFETCQSKVEEKGMEMKLVAAEYSFDKSRLLFYFTADGRVDFRELVKDLAAIFKTRIEMRQIGVRDEAKIKGGIGPCGLELCCATFIKDFDPINIRMAKTQRQPLDPDKISGACGRLFCCLKYEDDFYKKASRRFPSEGDQVITPGGEGKVIDLNFLKSSVTVEMEDDRKATYQLKDIRKVKK